jgi:hypothetical protein
MRPYLSVWISVPGGPTTTAVSGPWGGLGEGEAVARGHGARATIQPDDILIDLRALWALDCTFHSDNQGHTHAMLGVIDHGSRLLLGLKRITQRNAWTMLGHLCLAIGQHGKPQAIRTDNEAVFKSRLLRIVLKHLRIR